MISCIARQCTVAQRLRRVYLPLRDRSPHALHHLVWIDTGRKKSLKGLAVSVFHSREPDVRQSRSGRSSIRWRQIQNRGLQKYLENSPKFSTLVQSEARSEKRIAVLSNLIARNRSFSTHHLRFVLSTRRLVAATLITKFKVHHNSAVQEEDSNRKETVKRQIQQFENHPNRDSLMEDLNKTEEFNPRRS